MIRRFLEHISRNVVIRRKLPAAFRNGPLLVSPGASLRYWKSDLEAADPMLLDTARSHLRPGDVVWDIGANVGLFTFAAANVVGPGGQVLAVEADTWLVSLLRRSANLEANRDLQVDILPAAVSDRVGISTFHIAARGRAANYLATSNGSTQSGGVREVQLVPTVSLDWLLTEYHTAPTFIKIDVEGAEEQVLRGAERVLATVRPTVLCEVSAQACAGVTKILKGYGYLLYDPKSARPVEQATYNTLACPAT